MSIRALSLKELRTLAHQRLGARAAALKTRQELVDALEASERKKAPRLTVPLAAPLPVPVVAAPVKELPPDPVIWTGDAPLPQITARPLAKEFPAERLVWSAQVLVEAGAAAVLKEAEVAAADQVQTPTRSSREQSREDASARPSLDSARDERGPAALAARPPARDERVPEFSTAEVQPEAITRHFFLEPEEPRLPVTYGDNRVLTFMRDPKSIYAAWDFSAEQFDQGAARGQVVSKAGAKVQSFAVAGPAGGAFVEGLPAGVTLKVEVRGEAGLIGDSEWLTMPGPAEEAVEEPAGPVNVPSSVV